MNGHVSNNSGNYEWFTPLQYIESARKVMGGIDLDPASSKWGNEIIKAERYFDKRMNGLNQKWEGNIWMNPPYGHPSIFDFISKLETEKYNQAIVLVNNATETRWAQKLIELSNAICFHTGRIRYMNNKGQIVNTPLQGQMIAYIGDKHELFMSQFKQYGICLKTTI